MPFSRENRRFTVSIIVIVASLLLIAFGVQSHYAEEDNKARDAAAADDRAAANAYADCLTDWSTEFVSRLNQRSRAGQALIEAGERKEHALDVLINISASAQAVAAETTGQTPPGLLERYNAALQERVDAQHAYNRLKHEAAQTREENPLVAPKVTCKR